MDADFSSEEEMEAFEMTDADMAREADPLGRKRRRRTKEEALYGVFYEGEEEEEAEAEGGQRDRTTKVRPMAFVAGECATCVLHVCCAHCLHCKRQENEEKRSKEATEGGERSVHFRLVSPCMFKLASPLCSNLRCVYAWMTKSVVKRCR